MPNRRWQAAMNWSDPTATAVCICIMVGLGTSCAVFGFPTTLCTILFIMVRICTCDNQPGLLIVDQYVLLCRQVSGYLLQLIACGCLVGLTLCVRCTAAAAPCAAEPDATGTSQLLHAAADQERFDHVNCRPGSVWRGLLESRLQGLLSCTNS